MQWNFLKRNESATKKRGLKTLYSNFNMVMEMQDEVCTGMNWQIGKEKAQS